MKIQTPLFLALLLGVATRGKKMTEKDEEEEFFEPPGVDSAFRRDVFKLTGFAAGNEIIFREPGHKVDLSPRFRNGMADINPIQVSCESSNVTGALKELIKQVKCIPRDSIVHLKSPDGFVVSPNSVMVKKCGGMCNSAKSCLSGETRDAKFIVRAVNLKTNDMICSSILVPEDTSCSCGCKTKITDCLPTQKYDKNMCACKCIKLKEYKNCMQRRRSSINFIWDEKSCSCVCSEKRICTTGSHWLPKECRCAKKKDGSEPVDNTLTKK